jgi:hypothetical protein
LPEGSATMESIDPYLFCRRCRRHLRWIRLLPSALEYRCEKCLYDTYGPLAYGMYESRLKWELDETLK